MVMRFYDATPTEDVGLNLERQSLAETVGDSGLIRFGSFELDPASGELRKTGARGKLQEQPFQVLRALVERPGEVVTREELHERLWPGDTFVEFDDGLNTAVRKIRQALGDAADNPRFVETLPKRGYRFIAPVRLPQGSSSEPGEPPHAPRSETHRADSKRRIGWYAFGALAAVAAVAGAWTGMFGPDGPEPTAEPMRAVPLTSYPGVEKTAGLSPDGRQVAFSWDGEGRDNFDIYVQQIGSGNLPIRLTTHADHDLSPAWSPDGRFLVFARTSYESPAWTALPMVTEYEIFLMPAIGGPTRKVAETSYPKTAWPPDGQGIIGSARPSPEQPPALFVFPTDGSERRQLTWPPSEALYGDVDPAVSPDGRSLAFYRRVGARSGPLLTLDMSKDSVPRGAATEWNRSGRSKAAAWAPNGRDLIVVNRQRSFLADRLVRLSPEEPDIPRPLAIGTMAATDPAIAAKANRLVFTQFQWNVNLAALRRTGAADGSWRTDPFPSSTRVEDSPHYSPDGKRIVFDSDRSGTQSLWVSDADGANARLLHTFGFESAGSPRWSPDGRRVAFDSRAAGTFDIYVINAGGGEPLRLTEDSAFDHMPRWSPDGEWVYFTSNRAGGWEIWKISAAGGEPLQVTRRGGTLPFASPDGEYVYYLKDDNLPLFQHSQLWRMPTARGQERVVLRRVFSRSFAVTDGGVYFMERPEQSGEDSPATSADDSGFAFRYLHLETGEIRTLAALPSGVEPFWGFTVSPDEQTILFARQETVGADIMLVEDFR